MFDNYKVTVYVLPQSDDSINLKLNQIMATQAELARELRDIKTQNDKARAEILQKIEDLEAAVVAAGQVTPEVQEALDSLKASVQTDDDIVPDATEDEGGGSVPELPNESGFPGNQI